MTFSQSNIAADDVEMPNFSSSRLRRRAAVVILERFAKARAVS